MGGDDAFDVCLTVYFDVVAGLLDDDSVKLFDDAEIVEWVLHVTLELISKFRRLLYGCHCYDEVVYLPE